MGNNIISNGGDEHLKVRHRPSRSDNLPSLRHYKNACWKTNNKKSKRKEKEKKKRKKNGE